MAINQSINQPTNQPTNQPNNQTINQYFNEYLKSQLYRLFPQLVPLSNLLRESFFFIQIHSLSYLSFLLKSFIIIFNIVIINIMDCDLPTNHCEREYQIMSTEILYMDLSLMLNTYRQNEFKKRLCLSFSARKL